MKKKLKNFMINRPELHYQEIWVKAQTRQQALKIAKQGKKTGIRYGRCDFYCILPEQPWEINNDRKEIK